MKGFSKRLDHLQEYYFSMKLKEVSQLIAAGRPIINMGIGSPDLPPHSTVIAALAEASKNPFNHGYQGYQGIPKLRQAIADFYLRHYRVVVSPETEILPLMGSKEGIIQLSMAFLDSGDEVLVPDPGYPTYTSVCKMLQVRPIYYDLNAQNNWYPNLRELESRDLSKVKLMWVNYPHMPSGARSSRILFEELIAFGRKHQILILNDNPYSFILEKKPLSILEIEGAIDVAMELNSLSKTANMAGWRVGMVLGREDRIQAIVKVKSNMDSGMFLGIQAGAIAALDLEEEWFKELNHIYAQRRELVWKMAEMLNLSFDKNTAGLFVWARVPEGVQMEQLVDQLLYENDIFITPGSIFGENGKDYVRISLCISSQRIQEAIDRISAS